MYTLINQYDFYFIVAFTWWQQKKQKKLPLQPFFLYLVMQTDKCARYLPGEIGDHKKLNSSVNDSKSAVFNHHHLRSLIGVPETIKVLLQKVTQPHDDSIKCFTHFQKWSCFVPSMLLPPALYIVSLCDHLILLSSRLWFPPASLHQWVRGVGNGVGLRHRIRVLWWLWWTHKGFELSVNNLDQKVGDLC